MTAHALAGIIFYSPDPDRLARFYRESLGIPFAPSTHGGAIREHNEGMFGGVHFAIWRSNEEHAPAQGGRGSLVPTFRVDDVGAWVDAMAARGVPLAYKVVELGEGKRVATFADPDGNAFRLIQLG
jgi:predicted enzyme related to lactoylglutathione lyase